MAKRKKPLKVIEEASIKFHKQLKPSFERISSLFRKSADKTRETFLLLRPLSKREEWALDSIKDYISEENARKITAAVKQNKAKLKFVQKGFSFLVANKDLIPQLDSKEFEELNKEIEREFYSTNFKNFTERAWQVLPQYIGPNTLGQLDIKQAISLQLFSPEPIKILIIGKINAEILTCARKLAPSSFQIITNFSADSKADFDKFILTKMDKRSKLTLKFDLLFFTRVAKLEEFEDIAEKIILGSKAKVRDADIEFLKEYINKARETEVEIPTHLSDKLKKFVVGLKKKEKKLRYNVTPAFVSCVVNLCKASARMELRSEIESKDLVRVFEIVEKSIKG